MTNPGNFSLDSLVTADPKHKGCLCCYGQSAERFSGAVSDFLTLTGDIESSWPTLDYSQHKHLTYSSIWRCSALNWEASYSLIFLYQPPDQHPFKTVCLDRNLNLFVRKLSLPSFFLFLLVFDLTISKFNFRIKDKARR